MDKSIGIGADRALVASDQAAARLAPSGFDHGESALGRLRDDYDHQTQGILDDDLSDATVSVSAGDLWALVHGFPHDALVEELSMQAMELRDSQGDVSGADLLDRAAAALATYSGDGA